MSTKKIFKNDIGIVFRVYAGIDLTDATSIQFDVKKPSSQETTWTASLAGDNNYYGTYTTASGDLDEEGTWLLSLQITKADGSRITGESAEFIVYDQFNDVC